MQVHFNINWNKTDLYNEGSRNLRVDWTNRGGLPREGEEINIPKFIDGDYQVNELFIHHHKEVNVFDWIESTTGWEIERVKWDHENGVTFLYVLVGEKEG